MRFYRWRPKQQRGIVALLLLLLACGPLDRLREVNQPENTLATRVALIDESSHLAPDAYQKIETLPGYHLENQTITWDSAGNQTRQITISDYDARGNVHTITHSLDGHKNELYIVEGRTYLFDEQYQGWLDLEDLPAETQQATPLRFNPESGFNMGQLLSQFAAIPVESGREQMAERRAIRYELQPIVAEMAEALGQEPTSSGSKPQGLLWIDEQSGALLKSNILLYEAGRLQPVQEYLLEISQIGQIEPITVPTPLINPAAVVAATATAQAWTVLNVVLDYREERLEFELIPVRISQLPNASPRSAEVQLILRHLPDHLFPEATLEPFLAHLREQMRLSIPKRNLVVTSSGFRLENSDAQNQTLTVHYLFNADLEDFDHIELILSGPGNPLFAPVPVE